MEIIKTYDLENLKEIVLKEISVGLRSGRDHARINLISAQEISEILAECMVRENPNYTFVEKEHPETEMLENEIERLYEVVKDKDKELEELRKHLEYMKEAISDKNKCIVSFEKENKELREKYEALTTVHYVGEEECEEEAMPSCFGKFDDNCINCVDGTCNFHGECLEEI